MNMEIYQLLIFSTNNRNTKFHNNKTGNRNYLKLQNFFPKIKFCIEITDGTFRRAVYF